MSHSHEEPLLVLTLSTFKMYSLMMYTNHSMNCVPQPFRDNFTHSLYCFTLAVRAALSGAFGDVSQPFGDLSQPYGNVSQPFGDVSQSQPFGDVSQPSGFGDVPTLW